ncbi:ADP-ribosyl-(dinitrogen reductase) hydrolase [Bacillus sp. FJAT-18017]|uniref:ADP-ribosylglycohydrolase family protein n=1 Tax=Bacillus sp. FJAT-18017 TaxID=1705566 RepID=UPI0006ADE6D1|nr:ADP-ribosylglycohydrolase family protein [Bacillus sp. FJAT-18017]ALC89448.1 ADP-ribosyl-(dinitrogen reductase) hydrolase [Bacillus sp. FJAT-18017]
MLDKLKGALYGLAIGDALGGTTEFLTKEEISNRYGTLIHIAGGGVWKLEKGETTDDTAMTLAVARGILANPKDPVKAIGEEFLAWKMTNPKDIGNIIATVFSIYDGNWEEAARTAHYSYLGKKSAGNGTLMRCLPVALAYRDLETVEKVTMAQSKMTHYDDLADEASIIYNRVAWRVLNGENLKDAIKIEVKGTRYESVVDRDAPRCEQSGFVVDTMEWVLHWLLVSDSFAEVVIGAANEGYDTDTVAAIAGGLAGLACGYQALPQEYTSCLLNKEELDELAEKLSELYGEKR